MANWYKRDPNAALGGMAALTAAERGVYNSILDLLYAQDGVLVDSDERVARAISIHIRSYRALKMRLLDLGKIWVRDGLIGAKRVEKCLKEANQFSERQSDRSNKRWQKSENHNKNNGRSMPGPQSGGAYAPTPTPTPTKKKIQYAPTGVGADALVKEFCEHFWPIYPVKEDRKRALEAYVKARRKASAEEILAGLRRYVARLKRPGAPKPKWAQGWLNGERWKDTPELNVVAVDPRTGENKVLAPAYGSPEYERQKREAGIT